MHKHAILSERLEDQLEVIKWAREQKQMILDKKSKRIADAIMDELTPLILKNNGLKENC